MTPPTSFSRSSPPWTGECLLAILRAHGAGTLERVGFRENRRTIWSVTGGGRRLNLHAAYRDAPAEVVVHFAVLVREATRRGRNGPAYRVAARAVRSWPGVRAGVERARERRGPATPGPCCATPEQRSWLGGLARHLARTRFGGDLPGDVPVRLSRRMTSRLGHMRGEVVCDGGDGRNGDVGGGRRVVEIALSLDLMLPDNESELLDTLIHEMAHAVDWLEHGGRGHGVRWKALARRAGCSDRARCDRPLPRRRRRAGDSVTGVPAGSPEVFAERAAGTGPA